MISLSIITADFTAVNVKIVFISCNNFSNRKALPVFYRREFFAGPSLAKKLMKPARSYGILVYIHHFISIKTLVKNVVNVH
jgi:hypothetical protein